MSGKTYVKTASNQGVFNTYRTVRPPRFVLAMGLESGHDAKRLHSIRQKHGECQVSAEHKRLLEEREQDVAWKKWGPYLSERQWGTVREDYSESGDAWNYFTHDQARSRAWSWVK
jgi:hypothetical protein